MILLTFYETFQNLSETRGESISLNTSTVASNKRFHFSTFFQCLQQSYKRDPQHCARVKMFHFGIITRPKIHFRNTLNSAYQSNIDLEIIFCFT